MARLKKVLWDTQCAGCRHGLHRGRDHRNEVFYCNRYVRQTTKVLLRKEKYEESLDVIVSAGYTD